MKFRFPICLKRRRLKNTAVLFAKKNKRRNLKIVQKNAHFQKKFSKIYETILRQFEITNFNKIYELFVVQKILNPGGIFFTGVIFFLVPLIFFFDVKKICSKNRFLWFFGLNYFFFKIAQKITKITIPQFLRHYFSEPFIL